MGAGVTAAGSADEHLAAALARIACVRDYEAAARERLPPALWAYLQSGGADGLSSRWNQQAFERIALLPRVLRDTRDGDTGVELFGVRHPHPVFVAPTAAHGLLHADAEHASATAAAAMRALFVLSTQSSVALEDIGRRAQGPQWFQLYWQPERAATLDLAWRAERAGFQALVLTVDAPIQGLRNEELRQGWQWPAEAAPVNLRPYGTPPAEARLPPGASVFQHPAVVSAPDWDAVAWLIAQTRLPVLLKGILNPLDVAPALDAGAAGLIVSNHGGRVLDTVPAVADVLPAIVAAAGQRVPVLADGGIRRGTDVFKLLALGACAVLVGRPVLHGLAVAGASGVAHVLNLLRAELEAAMVLTGCRSLADIDAGLLRSVPGPWGMPPGGGFHRPG